MPPGSDPFSPFIEAAARQFCGSVNERLSSELDLRFGANGSLSVAIGGPAKGVWFNHETGEGGGILDLLRLHGRMETVEALDWLRQHGATLGNGHGHANGRDTHANGAERQSRIVAEYDYHDENGTLLYQVVRFEPKDFRQRRPNGTGWTWNLQGVRRVPYRLPTLLAAFPGDPVYIVEGEKDADALHGLDLIATCNAGGAAKPGQSSKWPGEFAGYFQARDVVVLPDNDDAGEAHALAVATGIVEAAVSVRIVRLPGLPPKGDVSDWLAAGGTLAALREIVEATPDFEPPHEAPDGATAAPEPSAAPDGRPVIRVAAGQLDRLATEAEAAIIAAGLPIYQRGADLVRPITREASASKGRTTITAALQTITVPALLDLYCATARWERYDARSSAWLAANPPKDVAAIHLARAGRWHVPVIAGVVTTPTMRPDGSILSAPGYDAATRLYHAPDPALRLPPIADRPTRTDAEAALRTLQGLLDGFPFVSEADRAVALAALVTPVVRGAMQVSPLFAVRATTAGTGKSYLVDLASAISTGRPCPVISAGNAEETEKRLAGLLLEGFPILSLDNVNGELGGDLLCQAVERPLVRIRRLGGSDITEIESRATISATGNGLRVRGDTVRRTLLCTLDANMERPELRTFGFDPVAVVLADRGRYVAACLTIVRAFRQSGAPTCKPLASFEGWSDTVRSALVWLGCADPCETMETAREEDPELDELREVMAAWSAAIGQDALTVRDIADTADRRHEGGFGGGGGDYVHPVLQDVLLRIAGERGAISTRRLGYWVRGRAGRIVGGRKIVKSGDAHDNVARWALRPCRG